MHVTLLSLPIHHDVKHIVETTKAERTCLMTLWNRNSGGGGLLTTSRGQHGWSDKRAKKWLVPRLDLTVELEEQPVVKGGEELADEWMLSIDYLDPAEPQGRSRRRWRARPGLGPGAIELHRSRSGLTTYLRLRKEASRAASGRARYQGSPRISQCRSVGVRHCCQRTGYTRDQGVGIISIAV